MAQDLTKLASQGRAYSPGRAWNAEELELLIAIEGCTKDGVARVVAAEYIRNGITSVQEYHDAIEAKFVPKSFADLQHDAVQTHIKSVRKELGLESSEDDSNNDKTEEELEAEKKAEEESKVVREELEAKAKELGIVITANWKNETIEKKIAEKS